MGYIINNRDFRTKGEIQEYFKKILNTREVGKSLDNNDYNDIHELLKHHKHYDEKVGVGINSISIEYHKDNLTGRNVKYPHFNINRLDGSNIDFSYIKSIKYINNKTTINDDKRSDVKSAMRFIVKIQINEFRNDKFRSKKYLVCPILNINFSKITCHIDHKPPLTFDRMVFNFLVENNLKFSDIILEDINGIYVTFKDTSLREKWFYYHKNNAILRATHRAGNLSQKKEKMDWLMVL